MFSKPTRAWPPSSALAVTHAASRRPNAHTLHEFEPRHVGRKERQQVARDRRAGEREAPEHVKDGKLVERNQPLLPHRAKPSRLVGMIEDDLRPDPHLLEPAQEQAEVPLVRLLGRELAQRERHRLGVGFSTAAFCSRGE